MAQRYQNIRVYAQLKPDQAGLEHLLSVQSALPPQERGYAVSARQLHLTLIHFGKVFEIYDRLQTAVPDVTYETYETNLKAYIAGSEAAMPQHSITLRPSGFALFGNSHATLVVTYDTNQELLEAHQAQYWLLVSFLKKCGLEDPEGFMKKDVNFMFAQEPKPHITLYKNYGSALPTLALLPVTLLSMPTVYPPAS